MPDNIATNIPSPAESGSDFVIILIIIIFVIIGAIMYYMDIFSFLNNSTKTPTPTISNEKSMLSPFDISTPTPTSKSTFAPTSAPTFAPTSAPTSAPTPAPQKLTVTGQLIGGSIYGGKCNIYTADSDINVAAVHAGLVAVGETKEINLIQIPSYSSFPSFGRNGIVSDEFLGTDSAIQIWTNEVTQPSLTCIENIISPFNATKGKMKVTGKLSGEPIYGGQCNVYTDDSDFNVAATQAGLAYATHAGSTYMGEYYMIDFYRIDNYPTFNSVTKKGITSDSYTNSGTGIRLAAYNTNTQPLSNMPCTEASDTAGIGKFTVWKTNNVKEIYGGTCNIYTADSDLPTAANHAGLFAAPNSLGDIIYVARKSNVQEFPGITKNGITSLDYLYPDDAIQIWSDAVPLPPGC